MMVTRWSARRDSCDCSAVFKPCAQAKLEYFFVALACSLAAVHFAFAKPLHRDCEAFRGHGAHTCRCDSKHDGSNRYHRRLLAGFESEYDVEKWDKAYRQGRAQWGSPSRQGRCGVG